MQLMSHNTGKLFSLETVIVGFFALGQLLMFGISRLDRYELSIYLFLIFLVYTVFWGKSYFKSTLKFPFLFLALFIAISSYAIDATAVDAAKPDTSWFSVFSYSLLGIETFFIFSSYLHGHPERYRFLRYYAYACMAGGIASYLYCVLFVIPKLGVNSLNDLANIAYSIMMPLPLFLFFTREDKHIIILLIALCFAVFTGKRMALLVLLAAIAAIMIVQHKKSYFISLILAGAAGCAVWYFCDGFDYSAIDSAISRFRNIADDRGSGRLYILELFWNDIPNYSIAEFLFGHGFGQFLKTYTSASNAYVSAHNDYAEIMFAHGFPALLCFVWLMFQIYLRIFALRKNRKFSAFLLLAIMLFVYNAVANLFFYYIQTSMLFIMLAVLDDQYKYLIAERRKTGQQNDLKNHSSVLAQPET